MKTILFFILFVFASVILLQAQSFSYMNASTGNKGEFPVDKDTNIYLFHGNRVVKTNKNFVPLWANTYANLNFESLLLSKGGSIYFIAKSQNYSSIYGRIDMNGNLAWARSAGSLSATVGGTVYAPNCSVDRIILDRNSNLVISGTQNSGLLGSFFLVSDTNGLPLKYKHFGPSSLKFEILRDSSGVYQGIGCTFDLPGLVLTSNNYSDVNDVFTGSRWGGAWNVNGCNFYLSKTSASYYVSVSGSGTNTAWFYKMGHTASIWSKSITAPAFPSYLFFDHFSEDEKGNIFYSISCGPSCNSFTGACVKADSNGVFTPYMTTLMNGYYAGGAFPPQIPNHSTQIIHQNNYYFDLNGYYFPLYPLTVQPFDLGLNYSCSSTLQVNCVNSWSLYMSSVPNPTLVNVSSYTVPSFTASQNVVSFSANNNYCLLLGNLENDLIKKAGIFPNPATNKISLGEYVDCAEIYDMSGKIIRTEKMRSEIDVSDLSPGIYLLKLQRNSELQNVKFFKE